MKVFWLLSTSLTSVGSLMFALAALDNLIRGEFSGAGFNAVALIVVFPAYMYSYVKLMERK